MKSFNRTKTAPIGAPRSNRNHGLAVLTSMQPGVCAPLAAIPLLREDAMRASMRVTVEMQETKEILMNPVNLRVTAYVVPFLAMERFNGSRDLLDKSYMGEPLAEGDDVVPFIETAAMGTHGSNAVYKALGLHAKPTDMVNTAYLEAYNAIWNFRAKNRSPDIEQRERLDETLAPAFWPRSRFEHIVPDFDQARIDGEIALETIQGNLPVRGLGIGTLQPSGGYTDKTVFENGEEVTYSRARRIDPSGGSYGVEAHVQLDAAGAANIFAEMEAGGIRVSLANIELAKKTAAFARMREHYDGHDDEYIIDMLMRGLTIPDQNLKQPILIGDKSVRISQVKRYATDSGNLAESAVTGGAIVDLNLRVPKLNTGGVVIVMAEAVPEQLFERQRDPFFHLSDVDDLPQYDRDELDPIKVDIVKCGEIDTDHANPDDNFGYAPLNWRWTAFGPRAGAKFYRPEVDGAFDEERQRLWAYEVADPVLSEDFYLVNGLHNKPFLDAVSDPFEVTVVGGAAISGITVFGPKLVEASNNYDKVLEKVDTSRPKAEAE